LIQIRFLLQSFISLFVLFRPMILRQVAHVDRQLRTKTPTGQSNRDQDRAW
jgi:hypothetical protein